ncbi:unnamed protein product [Lactuca saligna]|uniref:Uncharacterized protein n=1 Tax=Lactuca saligna TaxID=75948 RepID=A0AA35VP74_LACSI|nr:unnamed protein product [Lactuca saligna]
MAANESNTTLKENGKTSTDPVRPVANFPPPIWDDRLLSLTVDYLELEAYAKAIDEPKEELRRLIINVNMDSNAKLCLINSVYRLGLRYMFREEIECQLDKLFKELNMEDYDQADLHTVSTNFQVFRQHGYNLSCDVFNKFKDHSSGEACVEEFFSSRDAYCRSKQLHKEELCIFTKWIKDMEFKTITPYVRDRIPEVYLWAIAIFSDPDYSQSRIVLAKMVQLILVLDDIYDAYGTIEELRILTSAINSWEINVMEQLPEYIKPLYNILLNELTEVQKQLSTEGRTDRVDASKQAFQELAGGYLQEAEWRYRRHVPSFEEYLRNGLITSTYDVFTKSSLMVMGDIVSEQTLAWYESRPNIGEATKLLGRLYNDITTFQFEGERSQQVESVHTYMKTFGVPENVAVHELKQMIENEWKDINKGCLKPTEVSMELLAPILNLARMTDTIYKYDDRFTFPEKTIVEYVTLLFMDSVPKY